MLALQSSRSRPVDKRARARLYKAINETVRFMFDELSGRNARFSRPQRVDQFRPIGFRGKRCRLLFEVAVIGSLYHFTGFTGHDTHCAIVNLFTGD